MSLSKTTNSRITELLKTTVRDKLENYKPETDYMPFHHRLLGRDRYAMFSFIHSMNTTFGISIWEQIAVILSKAAGGQADRQYKLLGETDPDTEKLIGEIEYSLRKGEIVPKQETQIKQIRASIKTGNALVHPDTIVDLFVVAKDAENYFDITTAKPNMKDFVALKIKLLRWTALRLSRNKTAKVFARLAIPYNPYHPEPYERWTLRGLYDLDSGEILVGEDFWNFLADDDIYDELLDVFQKAGEELRPELDERFAKFGQLR